MAKDSTSKRSNRRRRRKTALVTDPPPPQSGDAPTTPAPPEPGAIPTTPASPPVVPPPPVAPAPPGPDAPPVNKPAPPGFVPPAPADDAVAVDMPPQSYSTHAKFKSIVAASLSDMVDEYGAFEVSEAASKASASLDERVWAIINDAELSNEEKTEQLQRHFVNSGALDEEQARSSRGRAVLSQLVEKGQMVAKVGMGKVIAIKTMSDFVSQAMLNPEGPDLLEPFIRLIKMVAAWQLIHRRVGNSNQAVQQPEPPEAVRDIGPEGPEAGGDFGGPGSEGPDNDPRTPDEDALELDSVDDSLIDPDVVAQLDQTADDLRSDSAKLALMESEMVEETFEVDAWPVERERIEVESSMSNKDGIVGGSDGDHNGRDFRDYAENQNGASKRPETRTFVVGRDNQLGGPDSIANQDVRSNRQSFNTQAKPNVSSPSEKSGMTFGNSPKLEKLLQAYVSGQSFAAPTQTAATQPLQKAAAAAGLS